MFKQSLTSIQQDNLGANDGFHNTQSSKTNSFPIMFVVNTTFIPGNISIVIYVDVWAYTVVNTHIS